MWIRSQDRLLLENFDSVWVHHKTRTTLHGGAGTDECLLGEYESAERALQVLGEIQDAIASVEAAKCAGYANWHGQWPEFVYQMPPKEATS